MGIRIYKDSPRVYFDMDGVLADFEGKATELNLTFKQLKKTTGIYKTLNILGDAKRSVKEINALGFDCWVLSKCPKENPESATEKVYWIYENFPVFEDKIVLTSDKGCVGTKRDFLVDDHPEWANANSFPGTILTFKDNWLEIISYLVCFRPDVN